MLKKYLGAKYALYVMLIDQNHAEYERTGGAFYASQEQECVYRMHEVSEIIDAIFGKPTGADIKRDARTWAKQVDNIMTVYDAIDKYKD